jgi:hypothetical protein
MVKRLHTTPLLEGIIKRSRIPWYGLTAVVALILLLLLILVAYAESDFTNQIDWGFWRLLLQPAIIIYILLIYPLFKKLWERVIETCRLLVPKEDEDNLISKMTIYNRRWEWISLLIGAIFTVVLSIPWEWIHKWSDIYSFFTSIILFSLLAWLIYNSINNTRHLTQLNRKYIKIDIFNTEALTPIARWSLGVSLAFVGGISISVAFQPVENLLHISNYIIYSILVCVTILLFFISMWSTHNAMVRAKNIELMIVRRNLEQARYNLKEGSSNGLEGAMERMYSTVVTLGIYEKQIQETREWPYNAGIIRRLAVTILSPGIVYLLKVLFSSRINI